MSEEDGLYRRKRRKRVKWDEHGRTITWDGEDAREAAEAQAAREARQKIADATQLQKERQRLLQQLGQLEKERQRLLELLDENTASLKGPDDPLV